jgi:hypothetical protein
MHTKLTVVKEDDNIKRDLKRNRVCECGLDSSGSCRNQWQDIMSIAINLQVP